MKSSVVDLEILPALHGSAVMVLTKLCFLDNSSLRKTATKITGANQHSVVLLKDWLCEVQQVEEASPQLTFCSDNVCRYMQHCTLTYFGYHVHLCLLS